MSGAADGWRCVAGLAVLSLCLARPAQAHPHVLVTVRSTIEIDGGAIVALHQDWTFDAMYTAFAVTGFGPTAETPSADDLRAIAKQNIEGMGDYGYFTFLRTGGAPAKLTPPEVYSADMMKSADGDEQLQLHFTAPLAAPVAAAGTHQLMVYDPSYYVAFTFDAVDGVRLAGDGAARCATRRVEPVPLSTSQREALTESFFTNLLPGADFGKKMAQTIVVDCH